MTTALAVAPVAAHAPAATMVVPAVPVAVAAHAPAAVHEVALTEAALEADPSSMIGVAIKR